jgi:hypothetical protein
VIAEPLPAGATNATDICPLPRVAVGAAGVPGTDPAIVASEATDASLSPTLFVASTVQVYVFELVRPVMMIGDTPPERDPGSPLLLDVQFALYPVMALPPSAGATNATAICPLPAVVTGLAGVSGIVVGTTVALDAGDSLELPTTLVAWTVHVYDLLLVSDCTEIGELGPEAEPVAPPLLDVQVAV